MDNKDKKRGRPAISGKSPIDEKKKKHKTEKVSLDEMVSKVSNNMESSFTEHYDWLQEVLPTNLNELYQLRVKLEPDPSVMTLCEIDDMIDDNMKYLNGNDELFKKIHKTFENFVDDDMDDVILTLLENFTDKVKVLLQEKKNRVNSIIRRSIGMKMFPELREKSSHFQYEH